jgi:hypothetical protein
VPSARDAFSPQLGSQPDGLLRPLLVLGSSYYAFFNCFARRASKAAWLADFFYRLGMRVYRNES